MPASSDKGSESSEMSVVRQLIKNSARMIVTKMAPSRSTTITLSSATRMKSA